HEPGSRFNKPLDRDVKGLRIAWCPKLAGLPCDRRVLAVVEAQRKKFESLGCVVEDADPDFTGAEESFRVLRAHDFYLQHGDLLRKNRAWIKSTVIHELELGARLTGPQIAEAEVRRSRLFARIGEWMRKYDFFVAPVSQVPPFEIEKEYPTEID